MRSEAEIREAIDIFAQQCAEARVEDGEDSGTYAVLSGTLVALQWAIGEETPTGKLIKQIKMHGRAQRQ